MEKNNNRQLILGGVVLVLYLVLALAVPFPKTGAYWVAFVFGLIAIAAQVYVMKSAFQKGEPVKSKFYGYPIARIGVIYLIVQIAAAFVLMALGFAFKVPVWAAVAVCVLITGISAIGFIAADIMRGGIHLTGDASRLFALDRFISESLGIPVLLARDPGDCCILGIGYLTENIQLVSPNGKNNAH